MKTTVEISDALFRQMKTEAARQGLSMRELIEAGLRLLLQPRSRRRRFTLRTRTFRGKGLAKDIAPGDWTNIRHRIYERRGG